MGDKPGNSKYTPDSKLEDGHLMSLSTGELTKIPEKDKVNGLERYYALITVITTFQNYYCTFF